MFSIELQFFINARFIQIFYFHNSNCPSSSRLNLPTSISENIERSTKYFTEMPQIPWLPAQWAPTHIFDWLITPSARNVWLKGEEIVWKSLDIDRSIYRSSAAVSVRGMKPSINHKPSPFIQWSIQFYIHFLLKIPCNRNDYYGWRWKAQCTQPNRCGILGWKCAKRSYYPIMKTQLPTLFNS